MWRVPRTSSGGRSSRAIGRTGQDQIPLPSSDLFGNRVGLPRLHSQPRPVSYTHLRAHETRRHL
eukprot:10808648-Prorocentrum_lima.AAC.1